MIRRPYPEKQVLGKSKQPDRPSGRLKAMGGDLQEQVQICLN